MPSQRQERINSLLQEEISRIIVRELQDEALLPVTITGVEVSPDLHHARVYASVLGDDVALREAMKTLAKRRVQIQGYLAESIVLRRLPRLTFLADRTAASAQRIETLLTKLAEEPPVPRPPEEDERPPAIPDDDWDDDED
jgi:ribosome-binding factor A